MSTTAPNPAREVNCKTSRPGPAATNVRSIMGYRVRQYPVEVCHFSAVRMELGEGEEGGSLLGETPVLQRQVLWPTHTHAST